MADDPSVDFLLSESVKAQQSHDLARALSLAIRGSYMAPHRLDVRFQLAHIQGLMGRFEAAITTINGLLERVPRGQKARAQLLATRAQLQIDAGLWSSAADSADEATTHPSRNAYADHLLGTVYSRLGQIGKAEHHVLAAANQAPENPAYAYSLGAIRRFQGRMIEAEAALERAIALAPASGQAHLTLAGLSTWTPERNHLIRLERLLTASKHAAVERTKIHFAAHKEYHDIGDYDSAWRHLVAANQLAALEFPWDDERDEARLAATIRQLPADSSTNPKPALPDAGGQTRPIFITGLPRSGSSLLERILGAHSEVQAMGELPILESLRRGTPDAAGAAVAVAYHNEIRALHAGKRFATDKLPLNFWNIGLIAGAMPEALVIVTNREPMPMLFSAFRMHLGAAYAWCYSLEAAARHYRRHCRLLAHWRSLMGPRLIEVSHESLVRDPESCIHELLTQCGLDAEPACFQPHIGTAPATTASAAQVREPINDRGLNIWKPYRAHLSSLARSLVAAATDAAASAQSR